MRQRLVRVAKGSSMIFYDLTVPINTKTLVFPGDPIFKLDKLMDVKQGDPFTLCHFSLGNHMGTHIDFPAHVMCQGKCSNDYPLEHFSGQGRIIEISNDSDVTSAHIQSAC